jgi:hypothetical protein
VPSPLADVYAGLRETFDSLGLRWYVFGAQAAILHGAGRLSADVDVTVFAESVTPRALLEALAAHGFDARVEAALTLARDLRVLPLRHRGSQLPIDLVLGAPGIEERFLARCVARLVEGIAVPVASREDLVVMKILAGRNKDLDDVAALSAGAALDRAAVRAALRELELALDRSDLVSRFEAILTRSA